MKPANKSVRITHSVLTSAIILAIAAPAEARVLQVDKLVTGEGMVEEGNDNLCSLIEAIKMLNDDPNDPPPNGDCTYQLSTGTDDFILLPYATFTLTHTVPIKAGVDVGPTGLPQITGKVIIEGFGATIERSLSIIPQTPDFRLFRVQPGGELQLKNLTLRYGVAASTNNAPTGSGGGVYNEGNTRFDNCVLQANTATHNGGAVSSTGTLSIVTTLVHGNSAGGIGGGIEHRGNIGIVDSTISNNTSTRNGGGMFMEQGLLTLFNSTITGNTSTNYGGAALYVSGTAVVRNSTIANNTSVFGGGAIQIGSNKSTFTNCTIAGNKGNTGGAGIVSFGTATLTNSIVSTNTGNSGGECFGSIIDGGHNLFGDNTCGRAADPDPKLEPLGNNGGVSQTMALIAGSPAIDAAGECGLPTDQRGQPRSACKCDIGAYEKTEATPDNDSCKSNFFVVPIPGGKTVIFGL